MWKKAGQQSKLPETWGRLQAKGKCKGQIILVYYLSQICCLLTHFIYLEVLFQNRVYECPWCGFMSTFYQCVGFIHQRRNCCHTQNHYEGLQKCPWKDCKVTHEYFEMRLHLEMEVKNKVTFSYICWAHSVLFNYISSLSTFQLYFFSTGQRWLLLFQRMLNIIYMEIDHVIVSTADIFHIHFLFFSTFLMMIRLTENSFFVGSFSDDNVKTGFQYHTIHLIYVAK